MAKDLPRGEGQRRGGVGLPLYYWGFSGQLKLALTASSPWRRGEGNLLRGHGRASALLMAAEGNGFADVLAYYDHLTEHLQWTNLGHVLAGETGTWGTSGQARTGPGPSPGGPPWGEGALSPGLVVSGKKALRRMPEGLLA